MTDDTVNQIARRVAIHQAVDRIVDARRRLGHDARTAQDDVLLRLRVISSDPPSHEVEGAWQAIAAIAQGQLEHAMEERAR